eukprot:7695318-Lingulodinium_polyedra.AAC.1
MARVVAGLREERCFPEKVGIKTSAAVPLRHLGRQGAVFHERPFLVLNGFLHLRCAPGRVFPG